MSRSRVFVCSQLAPLLSPEWTGDARETQIERDRLFARNQQRAEALCRWVADDKSKRPFAPQIFYTRFLDDFDPDARLLGMMLGTEDLAECNDLWVFLPEDGRPTRGMTQEIIKATELGMAIRYFHFEEWWAEAGKYCPDAA